MNDLIFVPYEKRYKYPGMMPLDKAIWERFIEQNPAAFIECAYNIAVGGGTEMDTVVNPASGGDINKLYQRKIDVVARAAAGLVIIELKPRATTSSIGQVKGYLTLFKRDFSPTEKLAAMVITDNIMPDMEFLAKEESVTVMLA